jgi:L-iditol 2-dehydrogenase/threonine 3-dehydrogenase
MVRPGGRVVLIGIHADTVEFNPTPMIRSGKSIISAYGSTPDQWRRVLRMLSSGVIDVEPVITHRLPLDRAEEGFSLALSGNAAKVLLLP